MSTDTRTDSGEEPAPQTELTSEEFTGLRIGHPHQRAAGPMAVAKLRREEQEKANFVLPFFYS